jgi:hypothetical protein
MLAAVVVFTGGLVLTAPGGSHGGKSCDEDKQCKKCEEGVKHSHKGHAKHAMMKAMHKDQAESAKHLQTALAKLTAAEDALKDGKTKAAHKAIKQARKLVATVHDNVRPAVANKKCPIMGSKIKAEKVPANLYRMHKGKGIGFCCAGCPAAWDKLSEEKKTEKLTALGVDFPKTEKDDVQYVDPDASETADAINGALNGGESKSCGSKKRSCGAR